MDTHELLKKKKELTDAAKEIQSRVYAERNGEWLGDEAAKYDSLLDQADKVQAEILRMARLDAAEKATSELIEPNGRRSEPVIHAPNSREVRAFGKITDRDRTEGLRAWMAAGNPELPVTEVQHQAAAKVGIDIHSRMLHLQFGPALRSTTADDLREWNQAVTEQRAALTGAQGTTTTGGYTVADELMRSLEVALLAFGGMRSVATVIRTSTGGSMPIPTTNDTSNKGEIIAENTTQNELEMTFGQLTLDAFKYTSKYIKASVEFIQDSSINVNQFLGEALANRIGRITNDHFTTGTGSSQPLGVVAAAASGVTGVADPPTHDNLIDLIHSIDPAYRNNGRFMMNDTTLKTLRKIKILQYSGDTVGVPLWQPTVTQGVPDAILGFPYVINQSMASPGSTAKKILFGDFSKYIIRDVRDFTLLRLDERFAELQQVAFLAFSRHDGDLLDAGTNPVKYMSQA